MMNEMYHASVRVGVSRFGGPKWAVGILVLLSMISIVDAQPRWKVLDDTMSAPRLLFDAFWISENEVLIVGGHTSGTKLSVTNACDIFNVDNRTVRPGPSMNLPHAAGGAVQMPDGAIVVLGGAIGINLNVTEAVERFDPKTRTWEHVGVLTQPRTQMGAIALDSHRILVVGGRLSQSNALDVVGTCEIFDLRTGVSARTADHPYRTSLGTLVRSKTGQILSYGGRDGVEGSNRYAEVFQFDTTLLRWRIAGGFPSPIYFPTTLRLDNGDLLALGGSFEERTTAFLRDSMADWICTWNDDGFDSLGALRQPLSVHSAVQYAPETVLVAGGKQSTKTVVANCEWVDLRTFRSSPAPAMTTPRAQFILLRAERNGGRRVFAIGGLTVNSGVVNTIEELIDCDPDQKVQYKPEDYVLAGNARPDNNSIVLTEAQPYSAGAVWGRKQVEVTGGFTTSFTFRMTNGHDDDQPDGSLPGADGIVFVVQNAGVAALGKSGEGIGYAGMPKALAVEFDTYLNPAYSDPNGNHIAVQSGGQGPCRPEHVAPYNLGITTDIVTMIPDGRIYHGRIDYHGNRLSIYLDTTGRFERPALVVDSVDIANLLGLGSAGTAWIGFTSATGKSVERHELMSWNIDACAGLVTSVEDNGTGRDDVGRTFIAPMPSRDAARLFTTAISGEKVTIVLYDVTGATLGTMMAGADELASGIDLPFQPPTGTYYLHITDGMRSVMLPWMVVR